MNIDENWPIVGMKPVVGRVFIGEDYFDVSDGIGYNNTTRIFKFRINQFIR